MRLHVTLIKWTDAEGLNNSCFFNDTIFCFADVVMDWFSFYSFEIC